MDEKVFIKDRSLQSLKNSWWGVSKPKVYGFLSLTEMTENEIEMMTLSRQLYQYIPKVINWDRQKEELIVEKINGEHLDNYILRTKNLDILNKFKDAIKALRSKEVTLKSVNENHYTSGYICYHDYHFKNFIVDSQNNIWFIDWDIASLYPSYRLGDDDASIGNFLKEIESLLKNP